MLDASQLSANPKWNADQLAPSILDADGLQLGVGKKLVDEGVGQMHLAIAAD